MISRLLSASLNFMYLCLCTIAIWPSPEAVERFLLSAFQEHYRSMFIIIDCSEIRCEVPSSLPLQSQLYSSYDCNTTLKGLLGITPSRPVSFMSELFTGKSISDQEILQQSGLLHMLKTLPPEESLMAGKGFDAEDFLALHGTRGNILPLIGAQQLPGPDGLRM